VNVRYVYQQPYQMAQWLRENTPSDAVVAVHDVGLMRYLGERTTLDMVGLTTPGAAGYWRNGPGSVAEFLLKEQPDYIASYGYGHGYGLAYLADTQIFGEPLALFTIEDWQRWRNVALAADTQGIYQPDWEALASAHEVSNCTADPDAVIWSLQVADLVSESQAQYQWDTQLTQGFVSEVRQVGAVADGYRLLNREEVFSPEIPAEYTEQSLLLSTRVHPQYAGTMDIYVDEQHIAARWIPEIPGEWLRIDTLIPAEVVREGLTIRIVPQAGEGYYMPACHTLTPYDENFQSDFDAAIATYQDGAFALQTVEICEDCRDEQVIFDLSFMASSNVTGDYRFFLHLYDDANQPPLVQWDGYFNGIPVGNWLPGEHHQQFLLDVSEVAAGTYQLAIGFYNPNQPTDRLHAISETVTVTDDGRLWLGEVSIGQ